jgi:hypothetical protein
VPRAADVYESSSLVKSDIGSSSKSRLGRLPFFHTDCRGSSCSSGCRDCWESLYTISFIPRCGGPVKKLFGRKGCEEAGGNEQSVGEGEISSSKVREVAVCACVPKTKFSNMLLVFVSMLGSINHGPDRRRMSGEDPIMNPFAPLVETPWLIPELR